MSVVAYIMQPINTLEISNVFMGCIMYADDLILISPTVGGLQSMLTVCTNYGHSFDIVFNAKKCT